MHNETGRRPIRPDGFDVAIFIKVHAIATSMSDGGKVFCVLCGVEKRLYNSVCKDCFLSNNRLVELPSVASATMCPHCGVAEIGKHWEDISVEQAVSKNIQGKCRVFEGARCLRVTLTLPSEFQQADVAVQAEAEFEDIIQTASKQITVKIISKTCPRCSRLHGSYYEAIIQLRVSERDFSDEELKDLEGEIVHYLDSHQNSVNAAFLSKVAIVKGGLDFYISNNTVAKAISQDMANRYGAKVTESPKLAGRKDGRDIYRVTHALRFPRTRMGHIIRMGNNPMLVKRLSRRKVTCINLRNGAVSKHELKDIEECQLLADTSDAEDAVVISDSLEEAQVLDPASYDTVTVRKIEDKPLGEKASIIRVEGEIFLLPASR